MSTRIAAIDGLRGLAATAVLVVHSTHGRWPPNGGLAVDLFFMLSGFVLAMVYEHRFEAGMSSGAFLLARMARLYPLYIVGAAIGLAMNVADWRWDALAAFAHTAVFLPYAGSPAHRDSFWLDAPLWSLSFEMIINLIFGLGLWKLPSRALALLAAVCGVCLIAVTVGAGDLNYGWQPDPAGYLLGFARVGFGFPLGWLIWRHREAIRPLVEAPATSWLALAAVALTFLTPGGACEPAALILVYPPAVCVLALGAQPSGRLARLAMFAGALSYPLYITHVLVLQGLWASLGPDAGWLAWVAAPALAWVAHKTVEPMGRRWVMGMAERRHAAGAAVG